MLKYCGLWKERSGRNLHPYSVLSAPHFLIAIPIASASSLFLAMGASTMQPLPFRIQQNSSVQIQLFQRVSYSGHLTWSQTRVEEVHSFITAVDIFYIVLGHTWRSFMHCIISPSVSSKAKLLEQKRRCPSGLRACTCLFPCFSVESSQRSKL